MVSRLIVIDPDKTPSFHRLSIDITSSFNGTKSQDVPL